MASPSDTELYYLGLMSGTSMDGIDAVLVRFGDHQCDVVHAHQQPYPEALRSALRDATQNPETLTIDRLGSMDHWVADCFSAAALAVVTESNIDPSQIGAIGSHGQTVRHRPHSDRPFTLQIGDPNRIAATTGITTVADFRRRDLALGGEGAPLAPAFHQWLFAANNDNCVVLNLGGIANVTVLARKSSATIGFDTGPANTLLDAWINDSQSKAFDDGGEWAKSGNVIQPLLQKMLSDSYFSAAPPKSTGFEHFNLSWIHRAIEDSDLPTTPATNDVQATLVELTAQSVADDIGRHAADTSTIVVCGGGVHNAHLLSRLQNKMPLVSITSTTPFGLDPNCVEATAFAWLAMQTLKQRPGNLPSVTGASQPAVLGGVFFGTS